METTGNENSSTAASVGGLSAANSVLYQGFWVFPEALGSIKHFQQNYKALDTDLILASVPKAGTLWLKALAFAIVNRTRYPSTISSSHHHPLLTVSPHELVPFADFKHVFPTCSLLDYTKLPSNNQDSSCRLIATHVPYPSLPASIMDSATKCKVVYICRNPQDTFISLWHFINKIRTLPAESNDTSTPRLSHDKNSTPLSIEEAFEFFCDGVTDYGPYWDHVLGYWKASLERPHKVLFLKYEDLKKEPETLLKKLAEFMGYGFSIEEEKQGMIREILSLCSFQHLKNLDVNKNGTIYNDYVANKDFFRKGEVGDWKNYLTPPMVERLNRLTEEKLGGSGLVFQNHIP